MVVRGNQLIPITPHNPPRAGEKTQDVLCRFRTLGCSPCTGAIRSAALTIDEIIDEMEQTKTSERSTRIIDHDTEGSMELKKREGYF
jgi:sulfate adenylyltransferase subunit 2